MELIDSNGNMWTWKYDYVNKTNLPGSLKKTLNFDDVKGIIENYYRNSKVENKIKDLIEDKSTIRELIETIADRL